MLGIAAAQVAEVNKIQFRFNSMGLGGQPAVSGMSLLVRKLVQGKAIDALTRSLCGVELWWPFTFDSAKFSVRYHAGISDDFLDACVQVIRCGFGMPAFNNDEIVIPEFIKLGVEPQDAYDYAVPMVALKLRCQLSLYRKSFINFVSR